MMRRTSYLSARFSTYLMPPPFRRLIPFFIEPPDPPGSRLLEVPIWYQIVDFLETAGHHEEAVASNRFKFQE